jgi:uncharacterized iron-regulated membrane protein
MLILLEDRIDGYRDYPMLRVPVRGQKVSLAKMIDAAQRANPGRHVYHILFSCSRGCTYDLSMHAGNERLDALVDPYTGAVRETVVWQKTAIGVLYALHGSLLAGENGERINSIAGLSVVLLGCTGLYLWPGWRNVRRAFSIRWRGTASQIGYDVHKLTGFGAVLFLVMWAITAAAQEFWPEPPESVAPVGGSGKVLGIDRLVKAAQGALPGEVTMVYTPVAGAVVVRKRVAGDPDPYGYSYVAINARTGKVRQVYDLRTFATLWRVRAALYAAHVGSPGGAALRVVYAIVGLAPALLFVTALIMWLQKLR